MACTVNITKEEVIELYDAAIPKSGTLLQIRSGKVRGLGAKSEPSGIFKQELNGPCHITYTGIASDEHVYAPHGGFERALNQYASEHYASWRKEDAPHPELFDLGAFGENLVGSNMNEENVCIGDVYRIGKDVLVQVSEPRSPCYKLNLRFEWRRALKRIQRTGRVGWNYRVLRPGSIQAGDAIVLCDRPHPKWSLMNVKRVIQGKNVPLTLLSELCRLEVLTEMTRDFAAQKLTKTRKPYRLSQAKMVSSSVRELTFTLDAGVTIGSPQFESFAFAQIDFGEGDLRFSRSYSIVSGDLNRFKLGISLSKTTRGGSAYLHKNLNTGDVIYMTPGSMTSHVENEEQYEAEADESYNRLVITGGIGITAFLPDIEAWKASQVELSWHHATRNHADAAYVDLLPSVNTTVYAQSRGERFNVSVIPPAGEDGIFRNKLYCCGPTRLMDACRAYAEELGYPEHLLHFESFGDTADAARDDAFEVEVTELETKRCEVLDVPSSKSLVQVLREAGFDMTSFCEMGGCGACKVTTRAGEVLHKPRTSLQDHEKPFEMLSCVDRGKARIQIELD